MVLSLQFRMEISHEESSLQSPDVCSQSHSLLKKVGNLARHIPDPHTPVWVPGLDYPVQYVVRQTRSMTARLKEVENTNTNLCLVVSIPLKIIRMPTLLPPVSMIQKKCLKPLDFYLPDDVFQKLKLHKLQEVQKRRDVFATSNVTKCNDKQTEDVCQYEDIYNVNTTVHSSTLYSTHVKNVNHISQVCMQIG